MVDLFQVEVGAPQTYERLTVFPLFSAQTSAVEYLLSDEALPSGGVVVEEVSQSGSVPNLQVENTTDQLVLFLEGEELIGAKQNRVLNTSVLVRANQRMQIPVSCVEQGRWRFTSRHFMSGSHSSSKLRMALKASVSSSLKLDAGHSSDQQAVWAEVSRQQTALNASSDTVAMADTYRAHADGVDTYREQLPYIDQACGLVVAVGSRVSAIDLFDKPKTCEKIWGRLLSGYIMEAIESQSDGPIAADAVSQLLDELNGLPWNPSAAAGEGEELRAEQGDRLQASALLYDNTVIHASVMVAG